MSLDDDSFDYHREEPPEKIEISMTKPTNTRRDLSLAYSPGMAAPCRAIRDDSTEAYSYTAKGNLVGVIPNGSAVLGLGDAEAVSPLLVGIDEPVHVLQRSDEVNDIVNLAGVAVADAQEEE